MKIFLYISFIILLLHSYAVCWRPFDFDFNGVGCKKLSNIAIFVNCSLSTLPKQKMGVCFAVQVGRPIKKPKVDFFLDLIRPNKQNLNILNLTRISACRFIESRGILNYVEILRTAIKKYSKMPKRCPIAKNSKLTTKDLVLDPEYFPPYIPASKFLFILRIWDDLTSFVELIVNGTITSKHQYKEGSWTKS